MHPGHGDTLSQEPAQHTGTLTKGSASLERVRAYGLSKTQQLFPQPYMENRHPPWIQRDLRQAAKRESQLQETLRRFSAP